MFTNSFLLHHGCLQMYNYLKIHGHISTCRLHQYPSLSLSPTFHTRAIIYTLTSKHGVSSPSHCSGQTLMTQVRPCLHNYSWPSAHWTGLDHMHDDLWPQHVYIIIADRLLNGLVLIVCTVTFDLNVFPSISADSLFIGAVGVDLMICMMTFDPMYLNDDKTCVTTRRLSIAPVGTT